MESNHHYQLVARAIKFIRESQSGHPDLDQVAAHVHLSKFHFHRIFKEWAGVTPKEFWQHLTLERAKIALRQGQSTLSAAYEAGLSGTGRLHDLFIKIEACTPGTFKAKGKSLQLLTSEIDTPFGKACIAETTLGICRLSFSAIKPFVEELGKDYPLALIKQGLGPNAQKVERYFQDWKLPDNGISLDLEGSAFQIQVWRALLHTSPAQLLTYGQLARLIGRPAASRAVGSAVANNPIAYLIPCHRVILGSGHWGNYRWHDERKMAINGYESLALAR